MPWDGLARTFPAAVDNSSPIYVKRNILVSTFIPRTLLSRTAFAHWVQDSSCSATGIWSAATMR